jgi:hypothetical protein
MFGPPDHDASYINIGGPFREALRTAEIVSGVLNGLATIARQLINRAELSAARFLALHYLKNSTLDAGLRRGKMTARK